MSVSNSPHAIVRLANLSDLEAILAIETVGWPVGDGMRAEAAKFATRIACGFVSIACDSENSVLGIFTAFRPKWARAERLDALLQSCPNEIFDQSADERWPSLCRHYGLSNNWHEATAEGTIHQGAMHDPGGDVLYGVGLAVRPECKGRGVARFLLQSTLEDATRNGARYFLGYGRLPMFHLFPHTNVDAYLRLTQRADDGLQPLDPQVRFYWSLGARPIRSVDGRYRYVGIPGSMREDPESLEHGLLIVAPMCAKPFPMERLSR